MSRASWLDAFRLGGGIASLVGALSVAMLVESTLPPDAAHRAMAGILAVGLVGFTAGMLSLGREVTRRWLAFGASLGFSPASRRPFFDFGTDRPVLYGRAGHHAARMRLIVTQARVRGTGGEWLELETDLLTDAQDLGHAARAAVRELRAHGVHVTTARVEGGRLLLRAPFPEGDATPLVEGLARVADAA